MTIQIYTPTMSLIFYGNTIADTPFQYIGQLSHTDHIGLIAYSDLKSYVL